MKLFQFGPEQGSGRRHEGGDARGAPARGYRRGQRIAVAHHHLEGKKSEHLS